MSKVKKYNYYMPAGSKTNLGAGNYKNRYKKWDNFLS